MVVMLTMSKKRLSVQFGREVKRRREALGLTLEALAERAELTSNYIGTIENGHRDPCISTILAIANGLGVVPAELFGGVPEVTEEAVGMGKLFDRATQDVRLSILLILRSTIALRPPEPKPEPKPPNKPKPPPET
jgi:transcriptional regulator with XRE-family HTH domain